MFLSQKGWRTRASAPALAYALFLASSPLAYAEEAAADDQSGAEEEQTIVVTGIRGGLERALEVKRSADSVVDVISAEGIGRFPDVNIAESIQRITGVQINRTRGEGRSVNIRGLPDNFTLTTFNGRAIPNALTDLTTSYTRAFDFTILPSEFIDALEVYKSPTADLEDGGLSGVVNVKTPRALDVGHRVLSASAQAEYESNSGKFAPRISGLYMDSFADGRLGITLGGSYSRRKPETHQISTSFTTVTEGSAFTSSGNGAQDLNGDGVIEDNRRVRIPGSVFHDVYHEDNERISALGSIQFEANDRLSFWVDGFYSKLNVKSVRNENLNIFTGASEVVSASTEIIEGVETATDFTVRNLDLRNGGRFQDRSGHILSTVIGGKFESNGWTVSAEGSYARSRQTRNTLNIADIANGTARFSVSPGDKIPSVTYLEGFDTAKLDPNNFRLASLNGELNRRSSDKLWDAKLDVRRDFGDSFITSIRAGVKYTDRTQYQDNWLLNISADSVSALYGGLGPGPIAGSLTAAPFMQSIRAGSGSFLGSYNGSALFPQQWLGSDARSFIAGFSDEELIAAGRYTNDPTGILDVKEQTFAAYARADFTSGPLSGNIGLRGVRTHQESTGVTPDLNAITVEVEAGNITRVPAAAPITVSRSYWDYLPSLNIKYEAADGLQLRFSASRTITRPTLSDISPTTTANGVSRTITRNNPYLDPFRANNLDATVEWYFSQNSLLGASLFYKDLKSLIRRETTVVTLPVTYIRTTGNTTAPTEFTVSELSNGKGVKLKGVELYYQQAFTSLPAPFDGLGTILNYTFIDNSDPTQLTAASKHNFNAVGYYEKGRVGLRLSYSWRSSFLSSAAIAPALSQETRPFGTLDGSISFKINDQASLVFEAVNILDTDEVIRHAGDLPANYLDAGRRLFIGARISL